MIVGATSPATADALTLDPLPTADVIDIQGVSWTTYQDLAEARGEGRLPRLAYDEGWLEIVSPRSRHDTDAYLLGMLIELVAIELRVSVVGVRSTTFSRNDIEAGFEGDNAFYVQRAHEMRGVADIDAELHPAPDIVIEVDLSRSFKRKLALFAKFGVPEVWRVARGRIRVYELVNGDYAERDASVAFPVLSTDAMVHQLSVGKKLDRWEWADQIHAWVHEPTKAESN